MTKNQFKTLAMATGEVFWCKYSGHTKTMYVCCKNSIAGEELQKAAVNSKSHFKVKIG